VQRDVGRGGKDFLAAGGSGYAIVLLTERRVLRYMTESMKMGVLAYVQFFLITYPSRESE
jgi:hypothetical protein